MIRRLLAAVAWALVLAGSEAALAADDARLVLIAGARSPLAPLAPAAVRQLYLGIPLTQNGHEIVAIRNEVSPMIREIFLQRVLFMSAQAYERQISGRIYRSGGNRIPEYADVRTLVDTLVADPWAVSYMPADIAARHPAIRILGDL